MVREEITNYEIVLVSREGSEDLSYSLAMYYQKDYILTSMRNPAAADFKLAKNGIDNKGRFGPIVAARKKGLNKIGAAKRFDFENVKYYDDKDLRHFIDSNNIKAYGKEIDFVAGSKCYFDLEDGSRNVISSYDGLISAFVLGSEIIFDGENVEDASVFGIPFIKNEFYLSLKTKSKKSPTVQLSDEDPFFLLNYDMKKGAALNIGFGDVLYANGLVNLLVLKEKEGINIIVREITTTIGDENSLESLVSVEENGKTQKYLVNSFDSAVIKYLFNVPSFLEGIASKDVAEDNPTNVN